MALPVILIDSATGSDSAASGAGPSTALTGTAASFSSATVTLDGSPSLTGVATDGSHVLYMVTSTGVRFFKITAKNAGAFTVDVTPNPAGTSTGRTWAIGGKRASLGSASSVLLVDQGGSAGDAKPGWVIEFQSGHAETTSTRIDVRVGGDTTDGPFIIRGAAGAAVKPAVTFNNCDFIPRGAYSQFRDFSLLGSGGATNAIIDTALTGNRYEGLTVSGFSAILMQGGSVNLQQSHVIGCELSGGSVGIYGGQNLRVLGCRIHGQSSHGISSNGNNTLTGLAIKSNVIYGCGGDGINLDQSRTDAFSGVTIDGNTIDGCTGDGIDYTGDSDGLMSLTIINNNLTANGGYGLKFTSLTAAKVLARGTLVRGNNTFGNTSGACNLSGVLEDDPQLDPDYSADWTPQNPALEGTAFPTRLP